LKRIKLEKPRFHDVLSSSGINFLQTIKYAGDYYLGINPLRDSLRAYPHAYYEFILKEIRKYEADTSQARK
jgi:hypothetical protein